jgi:hypothetical protein
MSRISTLCLYGTIQLCTKHMAGFLASLESSPSPEQMEFCGNFLSNWNFAGILFGGLLARITKYSLNGSPREVKFHTSLLPSLWPTRPAGRGRSDNTWTLNTWQTAYTNAMGLLLALVERASSSPLINGGSGGGGFIARNPLAHLGGAVRVD